MIIVGDVPVLPHGFGLSLYSKKGFAFYKAPADAVHGEGRKLCAQLHQSDSNVKAMLKYIPGVLTKRISMEELLRSGRIDCAAMSRQLTADPDWPRKIQEGRVKEIHRCVRCNKECLGGMMAHRGVHCIYERKEIT